RIVGRAAAAYIGSARALQRTAYRGRRRARVGARPGPGGRDLTASVGAARNQNFCPPRYSPRPRAYRPYCPDRAGRGRAGRARKAALLRAPHPLFRGRARMSAAVTSRLSYRSASLSFLAIALAALPVADLAITALDPSAEFRRLIAGALSPA